MVVSGCDMPCYSPVTAYRSRLLNPTGKRGLVFTPRAGYTDLPVKLPCGQCIGCRLMKSQEWALRCQNEAKLHEFNCFITLTYNDENLPASLSLDKKHFQDFMKRLRFHFSGLTIRFFACGEYGDQNKRPHYHACIFGLDFPDKRPFTRNRQKDQLFVSDTLTKLWGKGHCTIGALTYQTAAYTARYVMKKMKDVEGEPHEIYERLDESSGLLYSVTQEFILMSRRPGLGSGFYDKFKGDFIDSGFMIQDGKRRPVPAYYLNKLEKEDSTRHEKLRDIRRRYALEKEEDSTPDRLYDRETFKKHQIKTLRREL